MNKKLFSLLMIPIISLSMSACNSDPIDENESYEASELNVVQGNIYALLESKAHTIDINYRDSYFLYDSRKFSKDLALFSYGATNASYTLEWAIDFYNQIGFDNYLYSEAYFGITEEFSSNYFIAHKKIYDYDLIVYNVFSSNYKKEWVSNVSVGETGHHYGFEIAADKTIETLKNYIYTYYQFSKLKILLTGFSRGAATANLAAHKILKNHLLDVKDRDFFTYTFETPAGVDVNEIQHFKNVFSIINSNDIVPYYFPAKYGLAREGIEIDVYSPNVNQYMVELGFKNPHFEFTPRKDYYSTPQKFIEYSMDVMFGSYKDRFDVSTRKLYCENLQNALATLTRIIMALDFTDLGVIIERIASKIPEDDYTKLLDPDFIYEILSKSFDETHIEYNKTELKEAVGPLIEVGKVFMSLYLNGTLQGNNFIDTIKAHAPEIDYGLLMNYNS